MKWTNTKDKLPEADRKALVKQVCTGERNVYCVGRLGDNDYIHSGSCIFPAVSRCCDTFWIYISDIEACCERE